MRLLCCDMHASLNSEVWGHKGGPGLPGPLSGSFHGSPYGSSHETVPVLFGVFACIIFIVAASAAAFKLMLCPTLTAWSVEICPGVKPLHLTVKILPRCPHHTNFNSHQVPASDPKGVDRISSRRTRIEGAALCVMRN